MATLPPLDLDLWGPIHHLEEIQTKLDEDFKMLSEELQEVEGLAATREEVEEEIQVAILLAQDNQEGNHPQQINQLQISQQQET